MSMTVLITGGLGNLGSWITREFLLAGHEVTVTTSTARSAAELEGACVLPMDLASPASVSDALGGRAFDVVIHAGSVNDGFVDGYFWRSYRVNTEGTSSLLHCLDKKRLRHFVYLSTFHVYGVTQGNVSEECPASPKNDYATSHLASEYIVRQHVLQSNLPATIFRLTNGYGCPVVPSAAKWHLLLNDLARMAVQERRLVLKSGADLRRDFVWMGDISKALLSWVDSKDRSPGQTLNLAYGRSLSLREAAEEVRLAFLQHTGVDVPLECAAPSAEQPRKLEVKGSKLWDQLGWLPQFRIQQEASATFKLLSGRLDSACQS
jgi:nucleoside-diphosphate-sugar epimerase